MAPFTLMLAVEKGKVEERQLVELLERHLDPSLYHIVPSITLDLPDGTTQIDAVVFSIYGVFVIELKGYSGFIYGSEKQPSWTYVLNRNSKYKFQNPLRQNYRHLMALVDSLGVSKEVLKSVVLFSDQCRLKTRLPENVICGSPVEYIQSFRKPVLEYKEIRKLQLILNHVRMPDCEATDFYHLNSLERRLQLKTHLSRNKRRTKVVRSVALEKTRDQVGSLCSVSSRRSESIMDRIWRSLGIGKRRKQVEKTA